MELKNRAQYLNKLISVQDMDVIKVVTGIRRCGKSSLLNRILGQERVIVSDVAGTTRDAIDSLFENVVVDITAEIRVMEKMMASEGLAGTNDFK